ncbi:maestro heat-like repeat-containing protein family member 7 [Elgaria multicarinata webbii]|uniref:maestro heat-like repeat-containing protein family member 7 n=1 Tax=Elgaria multicarinata webbii TaxID=159646 RepID=UPI002FCCE035
MYPTLSVSLLCQISFTLQFTPQEIDVYWRTCMQQKVPTPPVPLRSALRTFKALIRRASEGDQALIMNKRRGSELLLHHATHQKGLTLFARALVRNQECEKMVPYLVDILDSKEDILHIIVMTFLVELLNRKTFDDDAEDLIIHQLCRQLKANRAELRSLSLSGMLYLSIYPQKMAKLKPALANILQRLKETNREINIKALKVLPCLLKTLAGEEVNFHTLEVAARVIPLFDDASHKVRLAAISTFKGLYEVIKRGGKEQMKELALQSLVPLMVHLQDDSVPVTKACWATLKRTDQFLKSFIQLSIQESEVRSFCTRLVKRYREQGEGILVEQAFAYLENPRKALRDEAVRLLGKHHQHHQPPSMYMKPSLRRQSTKKHLKPLLLS